MKHLTKTILTGVALLSLTLSGTAYAEADYPFAATGFVAGGGKWLDTSTSGIFFNPGDSDRDVATIVGGGDFVIPVAGYWNVQLGATFHTDHEHFFTGPDSLTQFQGSAIGFWRNRETGAFGIEAGILSPFEGEVQFAKIGGVAEYFFGETATVGAFGGVLVPFGEFSAVEDTGFYVGGHATWYASHNLAFAGFAGYNETGFSAFDESATIGNLVVGGKVRYLTSMPGVELYASAAYNKCHEDGEITAPNFNGSGTIEDEGVDVMAGIKIRLGGHTGSLASIDRTNAIDTDTWLCSGGPIGVF